MQFHRNPAVRVTASLVLAVCAVTGFAATASAHDHEHEHEHRIRFANTVLGDVTRADLFDFSRCGPPPPAPLQVPCTAVVTGLPGFDWIFTGDLQGTIKNETSVLVATFEPGGGAPYAAIQKFIGTVNGCGTGSFVLQIDSPGFQQPFRWKVVTGSGTEALAGLSRDGTATATGLASSDYVGEVHCSH